MLPLMRFSVSATSVKISNKSQEEHSRVSTRYNGSADAAVRGSTDPAEITSRRAWCCVDIKKYVPMQQMLRRDVFLWLFSSLHEILLVFVFRSSGENTLADVFSLISSFVQNLPPANSSLARVSPRHHIHNDVHKPVPFPAGSQDIMSKRFRFKISDTQFFPYLAMQCPQLTFALNQHDRRRLYPIYRLDIAQAGRCCRYRSPRLLNTCR